MNRQNISTLLSQKLAAASFIGACLIPLLHTPVKVESDTLSGVAVDVLRFVASAAVPLFCMISGYLMMGRVGEQGWYARVVKSRIRTLLLPFMFWSVAAFSFRLFATILFKCDAVSVANFGVKNVILVLGLHPIDWPCHGYMWYVRFLFLFALASPVLLLLKKKRLGLSILVVSFIIWTFYPVLGWAESENLNLRRIDFMLDWFFPIRCFVAVLIGAYLRDFSVQTPSKIKRTSGVVLFVVSVGILELSGRFAPIVPLAKCLCVAGLWFLIDGMTLPASVSGLAFPIFVMHWFASMILKYLGFFAKLPQNLIGYLLGYGVMVMLTIVLVLIYKRLLPKLSAFSFGGRGS